MGMPAYPNQETYDITANWFTLGLMNPSNGIIPSQASFNGAGNAYPMFGTGQVFYSQLGYLFKRDLLGSLGTLQPYASWMHANYERLNDPMDVFDIGFNWLIAGNKSKISFDYQLRPVYNNSDLKIGSRASCFIIQYQISL